MRRCALLLLFTAGCWAQALAPDKIAAVERLVTERMSLDSIPAVSVAVATAGELRWSQGFGLSDLENYVPAKATTVYRLGSVAKPITAVAALQQWEQGKLDLDAPIQRYVPSFPEKPEGVVTARLLMAHLAGIRHYDAAGVEIGSTKHYSDRLAPLAIFAGDALIAPPGTRYSYTTYGFNLLGAAVEAAAGQAFPDLLRARIFEPAGMDRIREDNHYALIPNRAQGYSKGQDGKVVNCGPADTSNKIPGGGLAGTAPDLVKFALSVRTGKLLKPSTVDMMLTRQKLRDGKTVGYGLGWALESLDDHPVAGHSGGQQGTSTMLLMMPNEGHAVAVMCNMDGVGAADLARKILKSVIH